MSGAVTPSPEEMLHGPHVYRVVSQLGTDLLTGYCWCGQSHDGIDPVELWQWLIAHPDTHDTQGVDASAEEVSR